MIGTDAFRDVDWIALRRTKLDIKLESIRGVVDLRTLTVLTNMTPSFRR